jgi:hypothetical protein
MDAESEPRPVQRCAAGYLHYSGKTVFFRSPATVLISTANDTITGVLLQFRFSSPHRSRRICRGPQENAISEAHARLALFEV